MKLNWKRFVPTSVAVVLAVLPAPEVLPPHAWFFFAIFAGVMFTSVTAHVLAVLPVKLRRRQERPGLTATFRKSAIIYQ